jgi:hypothetical protein
VNLDEAKEAVATIVENNPAIAELEDMASEALFTGGVAVQLEGTETFANGEVANFNRRTTTLSLRSQLLRPTAQPRQSQ